MGNFFSSQNNDLISIIENCDKNDWKCTKGKINDNGEKLRLVLLI